MKQRGEAVVVVAAEQYDRASERAHQPASLVDVFKAAPADGRPPNLARKTFDDAVAERWGQLEAAANRGE